METNELVKEIHKEVREIGSKVQDMKAEQLVLTHVIREHERRSIALERRQDVLGATVAERIKPLEKHIDFVNMLLKGAGAILVGVLIKYGVVFFHLV
jgi:hypothetical protein